MRKTLTEANQGYWDRIKRAKSWIECAKEIEAADAANPQQLFILYWIAFNSMYGRVKKIQVAGTFGGPMTPSGSLGRSATSIRRVVSGLCWDRRPRGRTPRISSLLTFCSTAIGATVIPAK